MDLSVPTPLLERINLYRKSSPNLHPCAAGSCDSPIGSCAAMSPSSPPTGEAPVLPASNLPTLQPCRSPHRQSVAILLFLPDLQSRLAPYIRPAVKSLVWPDSPDCRATKPRASVFEAKIAFVQPPVSLRHRLSRFPGWPWSGARLRVIACIATPEIIERILTHLAARESGGINHPRAPPLRVCAAELPASPSLTPS